MVKSTGFKEELKSSFRRKPCGSALLNLFLLRIFVNKGNKNKIKNTY